MRVLLCYLCYHPHPVVILWKDKLMEKMSFVSEVFFQYFDTSHLTLTEEAKRNLCNKNWVKNFAYILVLIQIKLQPLKKRNNLNLIMLKCSNWLVLLTNTVAFFKIYLKKVTKALRAGETKPKRWRLALASDNPFFWS